MTRIEEIREQVNSNLNDYLAPCGGDDIKYLLSHIDTQAAELVSLKQQVERLRGLFARAVKLASDGDDMLAMPSAPYERELRELESALADGERGG